MDTEYLKLTVGDALTRGCAATATVRPADSVEYLAKWLHKYVKNESIKERHYAEKEAAEAAEAAAKAEVQAAVSLKEAKHAGMVDAVSSLAALNDDPFVLFGKVAELVETHTSAGMAYVGSLQPDAAELPELPEDDDGEDAPEPEDVGEEAEPEAAADGGGDGEENPDPFSYATKHLSYVSSSAGAEFMVGKELRRPKEGGGEDGDEAAAAAASAEKPGVTFDIVDKAVPVVDVPNVLYKVNEMRFFKPVPRVGAYYAQALVSAATGEVKAVVGADTTITLGKGKPFTDDDKKFIGEVAGAVSKCLQAMDEKLSEYVAKATEAHAPPPPPEEGAEGEEGAAAAAAEEAPPAAEGAEGEAAEGEEPPPPPTAAESLAKAKTALAEAAAAVTAVKTDAISILKLYQAEPVATGGILRGVMALLSNSVADVSGLKWHQLRAKVLADPSEFFDGVAAYDATTADVPSEEVAAYLRRSYFTLKARDLWKESPLGEPLKAFVIQARATIKAAAAAKEEEEAAAAAAAEEAEAAPAAEGEEGAAPAEGEEPAPEA